MMCRENALGHRYHAGRRAAPETVLRVVELHNQGFRPAQIARQVGPTAKSCLRYIHRYGQCDSPAAIAAAATARGGLRIESVRLGPDEREFLMDSLTADPTQGLAEYRRELLTIGCDISESQLCYVLNHDLKQHLKAVTVYRPERLTPENIARTTVYLGLMLQLSPHRVFFFDECAVASRGCGGRKRGRAPPGVRCIIEQANARGNYRWSVNCLCSIKPGQRPIRWDAVPRSTSAGHLLDFFRRAIRDGALTDGDVVVMDNCRTHHQNEEALLDLLDAAGVALVWLPSYSPHLNPIELFFNTLKYHLRRHHSGGLDTADDALVSIARSIAAKSCPLAMMGYYEHCGYL